MSLEHSSLSSSLHIAAGSPFGGLLEAGAPAASPQSGVSSWHLLRPNRGAQLQAFRNEPPHPITTHSTTGTAGLVVSSQMGEEEESATISKGSQKADSGQDQSGAQGRSVGKKKA